MSRLIEEAYARLNEAERARWTRAASVAQDERRTEIERALALDVTALLIQVSRAREVLSIQVPAPETELTREDGTDGA